MRSVGERRKVTCLFACISLCLCIFHAVREPYIRYIFDLYFSICYTELDADDTYRDHTADVDFDNNFSDDDNDADFLQQVDEEREEAFGKEIDELEESEDEYEDDSGADSDGGEREGGTNMPLSFGEQFWYLTNLFFFPFAAAGGGLHESNVLVRSAMEYSYLLKQKEQSKATGNDRNADADEASMPAGLLY